jgi:pimeloyl-ACP methyl ester carboxylesterase
VLFVQGVGVEGRGWRPQVEELSSDYACTVYDNRGIGKSRGDTKGLTIDVMARDALALLDRLGVARAHVVGHSLGGVIAQRLAFLRPERVASLALLCTFAGGRDLRSPSARLIWLGLRTAIGTRQMRREAFARLVLPDAYIASRGMGAAIDELEAVFGRNLATPPPITNLQLKALRTHDERARLREIGTIPTLVMSGRFDPIAPPKFGRALADGIGTAQFQEWADASHALPIQHAAAVNQRLHAHFTAATLRGAQQTEGG